MFALFRTEAIDFDDFPEEVSSSYDYWLTYLAVRNGGAAFYEPRRLTSYRVHPGSETSSFTDPEKRLRFLQYNEFIDRGCSPTSGCKASGRTYAGGFCRDARFKRFRKPSSAASKPGAQRAFRITWNASHSEGNGRHPAHGNPGTAASLAAYKTGGLVQSSR